mmetsp:Transcript_74201/g.193597  ORF Transcript_74201/g.193597 Transcript_74201/m.193597 type:complete len:237 (+) Transcript_74201:37-747(+)
MAALLSVTPPSSAVTQPNGVAPRPRPTATPAREVLLGSSKAATSSGSPENSFTSSGTRQTRTALVSPATSTSPQEPNSASLVTGRFHCPRATPDMMLCARESPSPAAMPAIMSLLSTQATSCGTSRHGATHQASRRAPRSTRRRSCCEATREGPSLAAGAASVFCTESPAVSAARICRMCSAGMMLSSAPSRKFLPKRHCMVSSSRPWIACPPMDTMQSPGARSGWPGSSSTSSMR